MWLQKQRARGRENECSGESSVAIPLVPETQAKDVINVLPRAATKNNPDRSVTDIGSPTAGDPPAGTTPVRTPLPAAALLDGTTGSEVNALG